MFLTATLGASSIVFAGLYLYGRRQAQVIRLERLSQEESVLRLTQRDRLKDEFFSNVAHELRTPLTSIRSALGLLNSGPFLHPDPKAQGLLHTALTNSERLVRLINDLLDLERMESGVAPLQVDRCNMTQLVRDAVDTMRGIAEAAGVFLQIGPIISSSHLHLDADPDRLEQVLINLISNAIKFSPGGSMIRIGANTTDDAFVFLVSDEGRGIPEDKIETIFERFQQVRVSDSHEHAGTGLGLAICRAIVEQHGGSIWAERNPRAGTTFSVKLPGTIALDLPEDCAEPQLVAGD